MKASELRELNVDELLQKEKDLAEELFNLKFQLASGQIENPMRIQATKHDLARVKTVLNEKRRATA